MLMADKEIRKKYRYFGYYPENMNGYGCMIMSGWAPVNIYEYDFNQAKREELCTNHDHGHDICSDSM